MDKQKWNTNPNIIKIGLEIFMLTSDKHNGNIKTIPTYT